MRITLGMTILLLPLMVAVRAQENRSLGARGQHEGETKWVPLPPVSASFPLERMEKRLESRAANDAHVSAVSQVPDDLLRKLTGRTKQSLLAANPMAVADPAQVPPESFFPQMLSLDEHLETERDLEEEKLLKDSGILRVQAIEEVHAPFAPVVAEVDQVPPGSFQTPLTGALGLKEFVEGFLFRDDGSTKAGASGGLRPALGPDEVVRSAGPQGPEFGFAGGQGDIQGDIQGAPTGVVDAGLPGGGSGESQKSLDQGEFVGQLYWNPKAGPGEVALHADRAPLADILRLIADRHRLNLVVGPGVIGEVTLGLRDVHLEEALDAIVGVTGHTWFRRGNLLYVTSLAEEGTAINSAVQGRTVRVFPLNYIAATDAQTVAQGLLSPVGQVFIAESEGANMHKTRDTLIVDDVPAAIERVAMYLAEVDHAPRQVLIETHIFQVVLDDENRHGVNLRPMARLGNGSVTLETLGFANENATQGMKLTFNSTDFASLVELIRTKTNSRTLASPKILATDRQESNIQIGKRLSYLTTTTTETASTQTVQFLDTGVVLDVTPFISADNQILLSVRPKVSGGQLNAETSLPEEESTELKTTVLLPDGGGVIIGGLIKDEEIDNQSSVPGFSRIPWIGGLFRRHETVIRKTEIIVALIAKIQDQPELMRAHERREMEKAVPPYSAAELTRPALGGPIMAPAVTSP